MPSSHFYSEGGKYSQEAVHALAVHIQQNRPRLLTLLSIIYHLSEGERFTRDMGLITDGLDFSHFVANVKEALSLDIQWLVGWLMSFTLTPRYESDMQPTTTIYVCVRTCRVYHFLKTNLEPRQGLPWPNCRSHC